MSDATAPRPAIAVHPLTAERWPDLAALFGPRGATGGCWCMWWRLSRAEFQRQKGEGNRAAFQQLVETGEPPGLLAYVDGVPAAWCAVQPREAYPALDRSRILRPVDGCPVWSVTCFFVAKRFRRLGLTAALVQAAIAFAAAHGARMIEAYPVEPRSPELPAVFAFTGISSAFAAAGFVEAVRRSPTRPLMRYDLQATRPKKEDDDGPHLRQQALP